MLRTDRAAPRDRAPGFRGVHARAVPPPAACRSRRRSTRSVPQRPRRTGPEGAAELPRPLTADDVDCCTMHAHCVHVPLPHSPGRLQRCCARSRLPPPSRSPRLLTPPLTLPSFRDVRSLRFSPRACLRSASSPFSLPLSCQGTTYQNASCWHSRTELRLIYRSFPCRLLLQNVLATSWVHTWEGCATSMWVVSAQHSVKPRMVTAVEGAAPSCVPPNVRGGGALGGVAPKDGGTSSDERGGEERKRGGRQQSESAGDGRKKMCVRGDGLRRPRVQEDRRGGPH